MKSEFHPDEIVESAISTHIELVSALRLRHKEIETIVEAMASTLRNGGKILWCGNGGSASDSQHMAAEIVGRFRRERSGFPSIALTTDSSILTAVANDYGYEHVFSRQVEALADPGDLLVGISTSGNSPNVVRALRQAKSMGVTTVALTGNGGGEMAQIADHLFSVPAADTARIQEVHILVGHIICDWLEGECLKASRKHSKKSHIEAL